ncbi:cupredoxin domain-containing protein [Marinobacterium marinum]|uniref:Copper-binding protein n=1 Tax=Marinobacterium marinum TaxID=2756129 RepID=A0A7W1WWZ8_9GAMM|nr:copper-binding protein [Marinobacterium marinum]MBA4501774.1 copper-binding protein [Marinobacterium marinum]
MKPTIRNLSLALVMAVGTAIAPTAVAEGDLTTRPERLPDLVLGSEVTDYALSQSRYELVTGQAYRLKVISSGLKEYAMKAPEFFSSIYLRKVEAGDLEIKAVALTELEFEQEGEAELYFVPIKPGEFRFYMSGLESKGMEGVFSVR